VQTDRAHLVHRYRLLGSAIDALVQDQFIDLVASAADEKRFLLVLNHNLHSLALGQKDPELFEFFEQADLIFIDGQPVVTVARAMGYPITTANRLAVLDWFWPLLARAAAGGWRVVHIGSHQEVIDQARRRIEAVQPGVDFVAIPGYFDKRPGSVGSDSVIETLDALAPNLILLGMGMPIQEQWLEAVQPSLPRCPVITVGGILGFVGGERPIAPRWMGPAGVEWLFRLVTEPRRLWHRYLVEPWVLARPAAREVLSRRSRPGVEPLSR
jgi:N-acetylglucosaminyldiphosphoundecaprenol N-acetyl-beta-D-mannosaminyltransferase